MAVVLNSPLLLFQMSHMGTYVCTAVEYVGKPGSRVSVYLRIIEGIGLHISSVVLFCKTFLTCSTGRWADTAAKENKTS